MTIESSRVTLLDFLHTRYEDLKRRLARRLGSADAATDALHDTFVRLNSGIEIGPVESPRAYLLQIATRLAADRYKKDVIGRLSASESMLDIIDDAPDPERIVEARSEIEALKLGMMDIPRRRRDILIAAAVEELPPSMLAERFGVTKRTIQIELKLALIHCAKLLDREIAPRMPSRRARPSSASASGGMASPTEDEAAIFGATDVDL
jgi:RNA polymerase sigma-70 factor (ECF subfamily)